MRKDESLVLEEDLVKFHHVYNILKLLKHMPQNSWNHFLCLIFFICQQSFEKV
jgi:hypothetical protein